jgi:succinate-acetate transporter protein
MARADEDAGTQGGGGGGGAAGPGGHAHGAGITRVVLRPLGSPLPLSFLAFGTGMLVSGALDLGWLTDADRPGVARVLLGFVVPLQALPAVLAFLSRDTAGGTALAFFAGSWVLGGLHQLAGAPEAGARGLGLFFLAAALIALLLAVVARPAKPFFALILALASGRFALSGLAEWGAGAGLRPVAGGVALAIVLCAFYGALALLLEDTRQRTVLPLLRRGGAKRAMEGDLAEQLARVTNEAGVRQQL